MRRSARIVGYVRPHHSRRSEPQTNAIEDAARANSWRLIGMLEEDADSGARLDRPQLRLALELLSRDEAHGLVVSSLDRLTPSLLDFAALVRWFESAGSDLVVLRDPEFDTSTAQGRNLAVGLAAFARWQDEKTVERISEDLDARRRQGLPISRPAVADHPQLLELIKQLRDDGSTLQQIANELNAHEIPTLRGGATWRASSIQAALGYRRSRRDRRSSLLPPPRASL
jgi:DNA invertase Pin-like site-specific DNA recombinase